MLCTTEFLQGIFPEQIGKGSTTNPIHGIMTDSRKNQQDTLFIPIIGERFDAHQYIDQAIKNGAIAALWDKTHNIPEDYPDDFVFFLVDDTVSALQTFASAYCEHVNPLVIGITGSNGKTTTKDLLKSVLQNKFRTHATKGNFNNEIGLPLTILQMEAQTEVLILEMGMSDFGEIELLSRLAKPQYAIITNIGESHIEHLGSRVGIAQAKLEIANGLQTNGLLLVDGDEPLLDDWIQRTNVISCGISDTNDVQISHILLKQDATQFTFEANEQYVVPLLGEHHAKNASFVITLAKKLGMNAEDIQAGLMRLEHSAMRFERLIGKENATLINDAYNASPTSMKGAINVVKSMESFHTKVLVLGDILELGSFSESLHESVAEVIEPPINVVYTYGEVSAVISETVTKQNSAIEVQHFTNKGDLVRALEHKANENTVMLFKASRGMAFEKLIEALR